MIFFGGGLKKMALTRHRPEPLARACYAEVPPLSSRAHAGSSQRPPWRRGTALGVFAGSTILI